VANGREVPVKPCRGSDSGSNPDSGASFLLSLRQQNATVASKKFKPEFKLPPQPNNTGISTLILPFTREDLIGYLELRSAGLALNRLRGSKNRQDCYETRRMASLAYSRFKNCAITYVKNITISTPNVRSCSLLARSAKGSTSSTYIWKAQDRTIKYALVL
jgi:hypothetical protein